MEHIRLQGSSYGPTAPDKVENMLQDCAPHRPIPYAPKINCRFYGNSILETLLRHHLWGSCMYYDDILGPPGA